jgi:acetyltransferase-like isoleucine patch superfamily enzyme
MGRYSYGRPTVHRFAGDTASIRVGSFTSIMNDAEFIPGGNHRTDWISTYPFRFKFRMPGSLQDGHPSSKGDIIVGNDVWIGSGARILSGVTIGDGAVIGAGAVVTRDVRPYAVTVGNPATEAYRRFSDAQVTALQQIAWWDWPIEKIIDWVPVLCSSDIDEMIHRCQSVMSQPE